MTKILNYTEARDIAIKLLENEGNITKFCKDHKINYQQLMNFKNVNQLTYQTILQKVLKAYGYTVSKVEKVTYYHLKFPKS